MSAQRKNGRGRARSPQKPSPPSHHTLVRVAAIVVACVTVAFFALKYRGGANVSPVRKASSPAAELPATESPATKTPAKAEVGAVATDAPARASTETSPETTEVDRSVPLIAVNTKALDQGLEDAAQWSPTVAGAIRSAGSAGPKRDSDRELCEYQAVRMAYQRAMYDRNAKTLERRVRNMKDFVTNHPDSFQAAEVESRLVSLYFDAALQLAKEAHKKKQKPPQPFYAHIDQFLSYVAGYERKYPLAQKYIDRHVSYLSRFLFYKETPPETKRRVFDLWCQTASQVPNYLYSLDLPKKQKYELARKMADNDKTRSPSEKGEVVWRVFNDYANSLKPADALKAIDEFVAAYGENEDLVSLRLQTRGRGGEAAAKQEYAKREEAKRERGKRAQEALTRLAKLVADGNITAAVTALKSLKENKGAFDARSGQFRAFTDAFEKASLAHQQKIAEAALETFDDYESVNEIVSRLGSKVPLDDALHQMRIILTDRMLRKTHPPREEWIRKAEALIKQAQWDPLPRRVASCRIVLTWIRPEDSAPKRAELLNKIGEYIYDTDLQAGMDALRKAAEAYPGSEHSVRAQWFLDRLSGAEPMVHGPLPRAPAYLKDSWKIPLALPKIRVPVTECIDTAGGKLKLKPYDTAQVAVDLDHIVALDQADVAGIRVAFDRKRETVWVPQKVPASIVIPLKRTVTLESIHVRATEKLEYTITLYDVQGQPLRSYERALPWRSSWIRTGTCPRMTARS
jgi:hypothetical protein